MGSRWYNITVVVLWVAAMSWLVHQKVLPSLLRGEPPSYPDILRSQKSSPPTGWEITFEGRDLGWGVTTAVPGIDGTTSVRSFVHFEFNEAEMHSAVPLAFKSLFSPAGSATRMEFDVDTLMTFDGLGSLYRFDSRIADAIKIDGEIVGPDLKLSVRYGETTPKEIVVPAPRGAMLSDSMSPQSHLPGLKEGQNWTIAVYKPFAALEHPTEILHATVERKVEIAVDGRQIRAWLVVYRSDPGAAAGGEGSERAKLWVQEDGAVVKQELKILGRGLTFTRSPDDIAIRRAARLPDRQAPRGGKTDANPPVQQPS